jgi:hypothetical protein
VQIAELGTLGVNVVRVETVAGGRVLVRSPLRRVVVRIEVVQVRLVVGALVGALVRGRTRRSRGSDNKKDKVADDHSIMPNPRKKVSEVGGRGKRKRRHLVAQSRDIAK